MAVTVASSPTIRPVTYPEMLPLLVGGKHPIKPGGVLFDDPGKADDW